MMRLVDRRRVREHLLGRAGALPFAYLRSSSRPSEAQGSSQSASPNDIDPLCQGKSEIDESAWYEQRRYAPHHNNRQQGASTRQYQHRQQIGKDKYRFVRSSRMNGNRRTLPLIRRLACQKRLPGILYHSESSVLLPISSGGACPPAYSASSPQAQVLKCKSPGPGSKSYAAGQGQALPLL